MPIRSAAALALVAALTSACAPAGAPDTGRRPGRDAIPPDCARTLTLQDRALLRAALRDRDESQGQRRRNYEARLDRICG